MLNISLKFPVLSKCNNSDSDIKIDFCDFSKKKFEIFARISKCIKIHWSEFGRLNTKNKWIEILTL